MNAVLAGISRSLSRQALGQSLLVAALLVGACRTTYQEPATGRASPYRIIGYVGGRADMHRIDARKLTHLNYAFALVSEEGEIVFRNPDAPAHLAQLQALKARNPALKLLVSVGGWGADHFSDAALTEASRARFARSAVELVKRYALDGVDLDWEYPGQPGPGIKYRPEDKQNFTFLLQAVRTHLDSLSDARGRTGSDRYALTIASAAGRYFEHTEMDRLHVYLDWINIMTYDFYGSFSDRTGHHTGLYRARSAGEASGFAESSVRQHLEAGIPPEKLVIGAAFYGRGWTGVDPGQEPIGQPYGRYAGTYSYARLASDYIDQRGFRRYWDEAARAPYLWSPDSTTVISYDDAQSLQEKARFVKEHGLGGIMYWEHSHDPDEVLLDALYRALR